MMPIRSTIRKQQLDATRTLVLFRELRRGQTSFTVAVRSRRNFALKKLGVFRDQGEAEVRFQDVVNGGAPEAA